MSDDRLAALLRREIAFGNWSQLGREEQSLALAARLRAAGVTLAPELPPHTRLVLASEDLLAHWGTRTERGERITLEWGEPSPEGWYEPMFTVHSDDTLAPELDVERQMADALLGWYDTTHGSEFGHDHHCPSPATDNPYTEEPDDRCTCGWSDVLRASKARAEYNRLAKEDQP